MARPLRVGDLISHDLDGVTFFGEVMEVGAEGGNGRGGRLWVNAYMVIGDFPLPQRYWQDEVTWVDVPPTLTDLHQLREWLDGT